jgi:hypothetical protein
MLTCTLFAATAAAQTPETSTPSAKIQTTDEANRQGITGAAQAPLRDLNVVRTKIPQVLLDALDDPYARPDIAPGATAKAQCARLAELVTPLNNALGADLDAPSRDEDDLVDKGRGTAFAAAASVASDVIPFRGWVRKLTGAEQHDRVVRAAITAGAVRRGYLKGLGEARGCDPPATPSHVLTSVVEKERAEERLQNRPPEGSHSRFKPRYPVR